MRGRGCRVGVHALIRGLHEQGFVLEGRGDALRVVSREDVVLSEPERALLRAHKADILAYLRAARLPASFEQQRLWFAERYEAAAHAVYNIPTVPRLRGTLDVAAFSAAFGRLVARHEVLRTSFVEADGVPYQVVHPAGEVSLAVEALDGLDLDGVVAAEAGRRFDLSRPPLYRARLRTSSSSSSITS